MINKDRIVPVQATDLLTLMYSAKGVSGAKYALASTNIKGVYDIQTNPVDTGAILCDEPVKKLNLASTLTVDVVMIPDFDFEGLTVDGSAATISGDAIVGDGSSIYDLFYESGTVTVTNCSAVGETGESIDATPQA
jgi:hypothetical protein